MIKQRFGSLMLVLLLACQSRAVMQLPQINTATVTSIATSKTSTPTDRISLPRPLRYKPEGTDIVITNGKKRFNRALYGTNTAFRIEAGDLPEFLLYLPRKGGNLKFGLASEKGNKWLIDARQIKAIYRPGAMLYEIQDPLLGSGVLKIQVLAMADKEGMLVTVETPANLPPLDLIWTYGGASGHRPSREGDLGADPEEGFYLHPEHCKNNSFELSSNSFRLNFRIGNNPQQINGTVPPASTLKIADARQQTSPIALWQSGSSELPVVVGRQPLKAKQKLYFGLQPKKDNLPALTYPALATALEQAEASRRKKASQIKIETPDPFLNTLGGALSMAADGVWDSETKSYQHGAIAWRMPLNGWRGAYVADALGWHDRAREHFRGYSNVQLNEPAAGPMVPDSSRNLARQVEKIGISLFTRGYISRSPVSKLTAHHYDMNMVFIDQLLRHLLWTGDKYYAAEAWPVIEKHLAWEKRNFDPDNNGLYDAYAAIWASDALQYSGGDVTHSSAYHYFANKHAARLAALLGKDTEPYLREAQKIKQALGNTLWLPQQGWYAEFKDALGKQRVHPAAGLWTVYHTLDSEVPDAFQAYQTMRYVDTQIPHIPIRCSDLPQENLETLATTNWMPYTWSINNVALAEVMHTALAYWQAGRAEEANKLLKSTLVESMFMGSSPGNLQQLSYYDHYRNELYRDFADGSGITSRAVVEGLFGIKPDLLAGTLHISPGFPAAWPYASLETPDIRYGYRRNDQVENYIIDPKFGKQIQLIFKTKARQDKIVSVKVNGLAANWKNVHDAVGEPQIQINPAPANIYEVEITWGGDKIITTKEPVVAALGQNFEVDFPEAELLEIKDPQQVLKDPKLSKKQVKGQIIAQPGHHTFFVQTKQNQLTWWMPVNLEIREPYKIIKLDDSPDGTTQIALQNNTAQTLNEAGTISVGGSTIKAQLSAKPLATSSPIAIPGKFLLPGSNRIQIKTGSNIVAETKLVNWQLPLKVPQQKLDAINLSSYFNDRVTNIFQNKYLSPRPETATLQLPTQGLGNWCYPLVTAEIDDTGLRNKAGAKGIITLPNGLPFRTAGPGTEKNILFTSQWDNYPNELAVPLQGNATHAYLLMAGSTNPMQSRFDNGEVVVTYADGSTDKLLLRNPETWWPIEQDYYTNQYSFVNTLPKPPRLHLKTGELPTSFNYTSIKGFAYDSAIPGGAATVLDLPLNPNKKLKSITVRTLANDVVIGLMGITLVRE